MASAQLEERRPIAFPSVHFVDLHAGADSCTLLP